MRQRGAEEVERNSVVIIVARQDLLKTSGYSRCPQVAEVVPEKKRRFPLWLSRPAA